MSESDVKSAVKMECSMSDEENEANVFCQNIAY